MDDVDSIMIMTLRQMGCNIDEEVQKCAQFTPELLMNCCAMLLNKIDESLEIPLTVPPDGPKRFKHCSRVAQAMQVCTIVFLFFCRGSISDCSSIRGWWNTESWI